MKDKRKEITLKSRGNRKFSDCYLQTVNPWAISAKLLKEYTRLVIDEEHKEQQQNTDLFFNVNEINGENK